MYRRYTNRHYFYLYSFIHSFIYLQANKQDIKISIKQTQSLQPQYTSVPA